MNTETQAKRIYTMPRCFYCSKRFKVYDDETEPYNYRGNDYKFMPMKNKEVKYCKNCMKCMLCPRPMDTLEFERLPPLENRIVKCIKCKLDELVEIHKVSERTSPKWTHTAVWICQKGICGEMEMNMTDEDATQFCKNWFVEYHLLHYQNPNHTNPYQCYKLVKMNYDPTKASSYECWNTGFLGTQ
jgi:hypothetical protein